MAGQREYGCVHNTFSFFLIGSSLHNVNFNLISKYILNIYSSREWHFFTIKTHGIAKSVTLKFQRRDLGVFGIIKQETYIQQFKIFVFNFQNLSKTLTAFAHTHWSKENSFLQFEQIISPMSSKCTLCLKVWQHKDFVFYQTAEVLKGLITSFSADLHYAWQLYCRSSI